MRFNKRLAKTISIMLIILQMFIISMPIAQAKSVKPLGNSSAKHKLVSKVN